MNVFFKKAEEIGSQVFGVPPPPQNAAPQAVQRPALGNVVEVEVSFEKHKFRVFLDICATAAAFSTQVYLATGVLPPDRN